MQNKRRNALVPWLLGNLFWVILFLVAIGFSMATPFFLTARNMINLLVHSSVLGLMVIGQSTVLLTGNFDLSAESTLGFTAMLAAWLMMPLPRGAGWGVAPFLVIPIILIVGALIGAWNGYLITRVKMNNFIVTLAMLITLRGAVYIWSQGNTISGLPGGFNWLGGGSIGPIPISTMVVVLAFVVAHIIVSYRRFGRELYAVGGNRDAAMAAGIDPDRVVLKSYVVSGMIAAFAAWLLAGRLESVTPKLGEGMIFEVFAASVIGGISLNGGRGTMIGAFGGVLLLSVINSGLNLMQVSPFWINAIRGLTILFAMLIDSQKVRLQAAAGRAAAQAAEARAAKG